MKFQLMDQFVNLTGILQIIVRVPEGALLVYDYFILLIDLRIIRIQNLLYKR